MDIQPKPCNAWNPQSDTILEHGHQVLVDGLLVFDLKGTSININELDPFKEYLTAASYVIRSAYHQSHGHSLGKLVFSNYMFMLVSIEIHCMLTIFY